jgi:hypothetical protein
MKPRKKEKKEKERKKKQITKEINREKCCTNKQ